MTTSLIKPLALSLAVTLALAACKQDAATPPATDAAQQAQTPAPAAELPPLARFDIADLDTSKNACTDLNAFVNSKWLAANPVPSDRTTWGSFEMLNERSLAVQKLLVEQAAADADASGIEKLIGDVWATGMDEAALNGMDVAAALKPLLDPIAAIATPADIAAYLRSSAAKGMPQVFFFGGEADFKDSQTMLGYAFQGGLGLPEKSYYTDTSADKTKAREAYVAHVATVLEQSGIDAAAATAQAKQVLAFETRLAAASLSPIELRNPANQYNKVTVADAEKATPNFSWNEYFGALGLTGIENFSLSQPKFFAEMNAMIGEMPVADWQAYLRFHAVDSVAPYLNDALATENFNFYGKALRGQQEQKPRWKRVLDTVNEEVGEALGQLYVKDNFPPESKARMEQLVENLSASLKVRIDGLDWMSDATKTKAVEKWGSFTPKIGYPSKWRSWDGLSTERSSYLQNVLAATQFNYQWNLGKIGKPVDKTEWGMSPQTVNAYYNPLQNEIVFPAAILQPPFFDANADDALNYGGIGAVIGHEMLHGYDDQGSQFDASGNFANWWSQADRDGFQSRTAKLVQQFDDYVAIDDLHVKGQLTLGENIADLGGLTVAYAALQRELENKKVGAIDGYTPDQRFFMNWATVWRRGFTPDELKVRLNTDPHAPAMFRAIGAPSNMPEFAQAFSCETGDAMVRADANRVVIW